MIRHTSTPPPPKAARVGRPVIGMVDVLYQPPLGTCTPPEDALAEMDRAGIAVGMISQCKQWSCERQYMCVDTRLEDVARYLRTSVRFAGLAGYNPFDATESLREMDAARTLGFRGTYLHAASFGLRLTDARLYPLFAKCAEIGMASVVELPLGEPDLVRSVDRICGDFPELSLALVHPRPDEEMFALCEKADRLAFVLDTSTLSWMLANESSLFDETATVERCMWGSNRAAITLERAQAAPSGDPEWLAKTAAAAMALDLPLEMLEAIVRTNALRYFAATAVARVPQALSKAVTAAER